AATDSTMFTGFQLIGYNRSGGTSAGTPASVTLIRCTARVARTTTQPGANGRVPASQRRVTPATNRALPSRPSARTSTSRRAISSSVRTSPSATRASVAGAEVLVTVLGDGDDLLGTEPGIAVLPHDRLEHQHHPRRHDEPVVELSAQVGPDQRHLRAVRADPMGQVQVREPRAARLAGLCGPGQVAGGRTRLQHVEAAVDDLAPTAAWAWCRASGPPTTNVHPKSEA